MKVQHNMMALNASRQLKINTKTVTGIQEKLSSGYKINRSADDAARLSISEKMRRQIRGLNRTLENIQDGISLCQVADGALTETYDILQRMNELAVKSANGTNSSSDRKAIQEEVDGLITEIDRIAYSTKIFGVRPLLSDAKIIHKSYSMPENTLHTLDRAEIYDNRGSIRLWANGMNQYPMAGVWEATDRKPLISVSDSQNNSTGLVNLTNNKFISYSADYANDIFISSYDDGKISFQIELTWKKADCSTDEISREYFELAYNFVNTSSSDLTFDFWFQMDLLVGPMSNALPYFDGKETENNYKWTGGNIPTEMTIDNFVNANAVNLSSQYTWDGIKHPPDIVMSGHTNFVKDFNTAMNPAVSGDFGNTTQKDYFYGIGWRQRTVSAGGDFLMQNRIGLYAKQDVNLNETLFDGDPPVWIQTGCDAGVGMMIDLCNATAYNLGINGLDMSTSEKAATKAIKTISAALSKVSDFRSLFGAQQNRLEHAFKANANTIENTQASESVIRDTDMAEMITKHTLANIVSQVSQSMLAQANLTAEQVLQLLK